MLKRPGPSQILRTIRIAVSGDEKEWELSTTQREPSHLFKIWIKDQTTFIVRVLWRPFLIFHTRARSGSARSGTEISEVWDSQILGVSGRSPRMIKWQGMKLLTSFRRMSLPVRWGDGNTGTAQHVFEWGAKEECVKEIFWVGVGGHACRFLFNFSKVTENAIKR